MELFYLLSLPKTITAATILVVLLVSFFHFLNQTKRNYYGKKIREPPRATGAWPIIGHLHLLGGSGQLPHKTLGKMAKKYGPIFTIKLGLQQALVVSNSKMAKECYTTCDKAFVDRPKSIGVELMAYNYAAFPFSPYGQYWRQVRKIVVHELLSHRRLELLSHIRVSEVKASITDLYRVWSTNNKESGGGSNVVNIEMKKWFGRLTVNVIVRMISGKLYLPGDEEGERFQEVMRRFFELLGAFVVSDTIPFLKPLDLGGYQKTMKTTGIEMDSFFQVWLQELRSKKNISGPNIKGEQQVFMDVMISILEDASKDDFPGFDTDMIIRSTCSAMLTASTDTTTVTLIWALSLLLNNPRVLKKAQDELDVHVGREKLVEESDIKNLVYLQAIIKETLRMYTPLPLSVPRESVEDCVVGGYHISKGTRLLVNFYEIHHDPRIWPDPHEFLPERFLTSHKEVDVRGQHFELLSFGSGRRVCPGISFGLRSLQLTLASLIHGFELARPSTEPIDMSESFGLTNLKETPLEVLLSPRLANNVYN